MDWVQHTSLCDPNCASSRKNDLLHERNKGTDKLVQMRRLVFAFIVHSLESIIAKLSKSQISIF